MPEEVDGFIPKLYPTQTNERELGQILTQLEYLRDAVKTAQLDITNSLLERKDTQHALEKISSSFTKLESHLNEFESRITNKVQTLNDKVDDHIKTDVSFSDLISAKLGKWVVAGLIALATVIGLSLVNRIAQPIIDLINSTSVVTTKPITNQQFENKFDAEKGYPRRRQ